MKIDFNHLKQQIAHKNVQTVFRLSIFVVLAVVIVLMFPRYNNSFRYHYELGKPWGYATLTADFDFPIYKTDEQLEKDQQQLLSTFAPFFKYIPRVQRDVKVVSLKTMEWLQAEGYTRIDIQQHKYPVSEIYTPMTAHKKFGYDCAINLALDTAKTEEFRAKLLATVSPTQGMVQKGEKIIDNHAIFRYAECIKKFIGQAGLTDQWSTPRVLHAFEKSRPSGQRGLSGGAAFSFPWTRPLFRVPAPCREKGWFSCGIAGSSHFQPSGSTSRSAASIW